MLSLPGESSRESRLPARAVVVVLTLLLGAAGLAGSGHIFTRGYLGMSHRNLTVAQVSRGGPAAAAGLRPGDRILLVDTIPATELHAANYRLRSVRVGETLALAVAASDAAAGPSAATSTGAPAATSAGAAAASRRVSLTAAPPPAAEILWRFLLGAVGLFTLAVGFLLAFQRPEKLTLVFFAICFAISFFLRERLIIESATWRVLHDRLYEFCELLLPTFFIHFFLLFPTRPPSARRRLLERLIYVPPILITLGMIALRARPDPDPAAAFRRESLRLLIATLYVLASSAFAVLLFVRSYRATHADRERAQLRAVVWGTVLGIAPVLSGFVLANLLPAAELPGLRYTIFALLLIPASFGYAAFRYRVFDLEVLVKRSVLYSVLTALVIGLYFGIVIGLGGLLHRMTGAQNPLLAVVSVVVITLLAAPARARLQRFTDRVFFPERYDARITLRRFSHELARMLELRGIANLLVERVVGTLALESAALLLARAPGEPFVPERATPGEAADRPAISAAAAALLVPADGDPETDGSGDGGGGRSRPLRLAGPGAAGGLELLPFDDRRALESYAPALCVPLWGRHRLLGLLLLGAPRDGGWSSQEDLELLETLGEQAANSLENALLHESEIERVRVAQELAVARDIQTHLVPAGEPECESIVFAGSTTPSHEIGGDFYDYVPIDGQRLGIAIGDVSGKGIPAALLMAGVQSSFRMEAERGGSPAQVLAVLNHRIHTLGEYDRFVCFFYGLLDPASRQLTYANGGLDPPILIRTSGKVERLTRGGPVLGVVGDARFDEGKVTLAPGDTLVLYTDGVVEPADIASGFGEDDLIEFLVAHRHEPAPRLRQLTIERLLALAGDTSLDDTTLIVARAR
jgi:sigma-B regulation protein RsbU (phosphoserine phosphatase)